MGTSRSSLGALVAALLLVAAGVSAQDVGEPTSKDYLRLIRSSRYFENMKAMAALSARVFGARNQGSDAEVARLWRVVAQADLSDSHECLISLYRFHGYTRGDIAVLVSFFESPLGLKLSDASQRKLLADLERVSAGGKPGPFPMDDFTVGEVRAVKELQGNPSYRKWSLGTTSKDFVQGSMKCLMSTKAVQRAGLKP